MGEAAGFSTPISTFDSPLISWPSSSGSSLSPDPTCSGSDETQGSWAGMQDIVLSDAELRTSPGRPPNNAFPNLNINFYAFFNRHNAQDISSFVNSPNTTSPVLARQPSLLYSTVVGESSPSEATWLSQGLFDRVTELVSHCMQSLLPKSFPRGSNPLVPYQTYARFC